MNVLCRNFILSDFCQICSSFFCFFRALSVGTPTFIIEPLYSLVGSRSKKEIVSEMAGIFSVSKQAMEIRLKEAGLL